MNYYIDVLILNFYHQPESQPYNPLGSQTSLDVDRIQRKNDERLRNLKAVNTCKFSKFDSNYSAVICYISDGMTVIESRLSIITEIHLVFTIMLISSLFSLADDVSLADPDDILDRFMAKQSYRNR